MVLPVGFFMPLPLPMMIPFMGIQSAIMAKQFGENFQYGKRKISAMSNEEFNKLTPLSMLQENTRSIQSMIPTMKESLQSMQPLVEIILQEFGNYIKLAADKTAEVTGDALTHVTQDITQGKLITPHDSAPGTNDMSIIIQAISNFFNSFAQIPKAYADSNLHPTTGQEIIQGPTEGPPNPADSGILNIVKHVTPTLKEKNPIETQSIIQKDNLLTIIFNYSAAFSTRASDSRRTTKKIAIKGTFVTHLNTLKKWKRFFNSSGITQTQKITLNNQIRAYVRQLISHYPDRYREIHNVK